jgi:hypothetical protein
MRHNLLTTLAFTLAVYVLFSVAGVLASYIFLSADSGWRAGSVLVLSMLGAVLSLVSGLAFSLGCILFHASPSPKRAAALGAGTASLALVLTLIAGLFSAGLLFDMSTLLILLAFFSPLTSNTRAG